MILEKLANEFKLKLSQVESTVGLIDDGNTIPFIARYRKEATGGLSDVTLRDLHERLLYLRNLEERKQEVIKAIEEQGALTDELRSDIMKAEVLQRVEDLYKPFRKKKSTRASKAREKGLEPLAWTIWEMEAESGAPEDFAAPFIDPEKGVATAAEALAGAMDILAEVVADDAGFNEKTREKTMASGQIVSEAADPDESTVYDMYYDYAEAIAKIPDHRVLAINRGESEKKLKVRVKAPVDAILAMLKEAVIINEKSIFLDLMNAMVEDAYKRLMAPSIEREMRNMLTERAEREAVKVFAKNTEKLLMTPPVKGAKVLSIDPGFRTGCKVTMLDETGKLLEYTAIYPTEPRKDTAGAARILNGLIDRYGADVIAIGNGTASRETEAFVAEFLKQTGREIPYTIVSEAGASIYSASKVATEEYPDLDVTTRGAMSIGKRLQDPLAELVKIEPRHIGVGQYQHDISQTLLDGALANVIEDCVNRVGVDLNTASPSLLQYIAGITAPVARNIVAYREANGKFKKRNELKKVPKLGEKTFNQCAGFMRITDGSDPLDATAVHPESYGAAEAVLKKLGIDKKEISKGGYRNIEGKIIEAYPVADKKGEPVRSIERSIALLAGEVGIGEMTLSDIVSEIGKPGRDPREGMPPVVFRNDVLSFDDLKVDMELTGTVRNVVDFGAFVDIGVKNDGLVHISQMSKKYIRHPMDVVGVGDTVKVKILSIDRDKQKVSLTMKL